MTRSEARTKKPFLDGNELKAGVTDAGVVGFREVDGSQRVVTGHPVLGGKYGGGGLGVPEKERVVPYAQAQEYVEVRCFLVENPRLKNRIAHGLFGLLNGGLACELAHRPLCILLVGPGHRIISGQRGASASRLPLFRDADAFASGDGTGSARGRGLFL